MDRHEQARLMDRWEAILNELADIDHLKVVSSDPAALEEQLQAELREVELRLTEGSDDERFAA